MLKKILFWFTIVLVIGAMLYLFLDKPLPVGEEGPAADRLTDKMLQAVNYEAWDSTVAVKWSFFRGHDFLWDKKRDLIEVKWDDMRVLLRTADQTGKAYKEDQELHGEEADDALQTAWEYFANDSFWLAAPFKITDPGTRRSLVKTERGDALRVQYSSGGVTPGDTYLWILDNNGTPVAWQLWVKIIPVGGMEFSWENWQSYSTGARLSTFHEGIVDVEISDLQLAMDVADLNDGVDPFGELSDNNK